MSLKSKKENQWSHFRPKFLKKVPNVFSKMGPNQLTMQIMFLS